MKKDYTKVANELRVIVQDYNDGHVYSVYDKAVVEVIDYDVRILFKNKCILYSDIWNRLFKVVNDKGCEFSIVNDYGGFNFVFW